MIGNETDESLALCHGFCIFKTCPDFVLSQLVLLLTVALQNPAATVTLFRPMSLVTFTTKAMYTCLRRQLETICLRAFIMLIPCKGKNDFRPQSHIRSIFQRVLSMYSSLLSIPCLPSRHPDRQWLSTFQSNVELACHFPQYLRARFLVVVVILILVAVCLSGPYILVWLR